jgi:hypothetical protein
MSFIKRELQCDRRSSRMLTATSVSDATVEFKFKTLALPVQCIRVRLATSNIRATVRYYHGLLGMGLPERKLSRSKTPSVRPRNDGCALTA